MAAHDGFHPEYEQAREKSPYDMFDGGGGHDATIGHTQGPGAGIDLLSNHQLERGLKSRHIQFLALGGAIGTGYE